MAPLQRVAVREAELDELLEVLLVLRVRGSGVSAGVRGLGLAKLINFAIFFAKFANFWRARSRLYRNLMIFEKDFRKVKEK